MKKEPQNILSINSLAMQRFLFSIVSISISFLFCCTSTSDIEIIKISEDLELTKLSKTNYIHTSWITIKKGAKFPYNDFVYIQEQEHYVFDTPVTDQTTSELITWLQKDLDLKIKGVLFNHFRNDCTEGADIFKKLKIPTIASVETKKKTAAEWISRPGSDIYQSTYSCFRRKENHQYSFWSGTYHR